MDKPKTKNHLDKLAENSNAALAPQTKPLLSMPYNKPLLFAFSLMAVWLLSSATEATHLDRADGLMPKVEIGALDFLKQHPEYDGRGVTIAIFDTGVDPGAAGLQTTPDGRPKIVDLIDGSGCGDVDTSKVVEAVDGTLQGLSGRVLRPDPRWQNPTGKFHIGLKAAHEFYPERLFRHMRERKRELWEEQQRPLQARLQQSLIDWRAKHPNPTEAERRAEKDLELRLEQLRELDRSFEDPGPVFDCVVFHDGTVWRAVVDTDEDGELAEEAALANYRLEHRYSSFGGEELLNFAVNIFENGKLLSIVTDSGSHGTHVAGIAAAYFPDQQDLNGVAPGAQIVSVKTGPNRLRGGNMETGGGIVRGLALVRELKCDIINASFGEPTARLEQGRLMELFSEIVQEDGVIFVAAAHNLGPALSTVTAPGGHSSMAIGVGAYRSPLMAEHQGAIIRPRREALFEFSSRGPAPDGAWGVSVSAPGSAVSPVPNWNLSRHQHMAGTSMATPSVSGVVALLLSGLKAEKVPYSPWTIRRALENTARPIAGADIFGQGRGLVQTSAAFELCQKLGAQGTTQPRFEVRVSPINAAGRGVYLREPEESNRRIETFTWVKAVFPKSTKNREKAAYESRFRLKSSASWVQAGQFMLLAHGTDPSSGSGFDLAVDPTGLETGVHSAEVLAFEEGKEELGPAFRVPITVIRPQPIEDSEAGVWREEIVLPRGGIERRFFAVPAGSTWAELRIRSIGVKTEQSLVTQAVQLLPGKKLEHALSTWFSIRDGKDKTASFPVAEKKTIELLLARSDFYGLDEHQFELTLQFRGVIPGASETFFDGAARVFPIQATGALRPTEVQPQASLQFRRRTVMPTQAELRPLDPARDSLPNGRVLHQLILSYPITMDSPGTVVPRFPALYGRLYDSDFESQLWMMFDAAKQFLKMGDNVWASSPTRLLKGEHTLKLHLRHDRLDWLEKLKSLPLLIDQALSAEIQLATFKDPDEPFTGRVAGPAAPPFEDSPISSGDTAVYFLAAPEPERIAAIGKPGDLLIGRIRYEADPCPVSYPLSFLIPPAPIPPTPAPEPTGDDQKPIEESLAEAQRDFEIGQLEKLSPENHTAIFDPRFSDLLTRYPEHTPLFTAKLRHLDAHGKKRQERLCSIVAAADEVIRRIDTNRLASHFGPRPNPADPAFKKQHRDMDQQRDTLIDALHRKARALAAMKHAPKPVVAEGSAAEPPSDTAAIDSLFEAALLALRSWADTTEEKYVSLEIDWERSHQRFGEALKLVRQRIERRPTDPALREEQIQMLKELGWDQWASHERRWNLRRFPVQYAPF